MNEVGFFMAFGGLCTIGVFVITKLADLWCWIFPGPVNVGPAGDYEQFGYWDPQDRCLKIVWAKKKGQQHGPHGRLYRELMGVLVVVIWLGAIVALNLYARPFPLSDGY